VPQPLALTLQQPHLISFIAFLCAQGLTVAQDNKRQTPQFLHGLCIAMVAPLNPKQEKTAF
jgi:hypothetical protein